MQSEDKKKKQIEKGIVAGLTSVSVLLGSTFDTPQDLINNDKYKPKAVIEKIQSEEEENHKSKQENLIKAKLRNLIYRIPVKIRTYLFVPLWFLGTFLISLTDLLTKVVLVPASHIILNFVLHILVIMAIVVICIKILFPDLPLSKILNKRTLMMIFIGSFILTLCDIFMPMIWTKYKTYRNISKLVLGLTVILIILKPFIKKKLENPYTYEIQYENETLA